MFRASLREQIAAQQRLRFFFHQEAAFPGMRQMRRIEPLHGMFAKGEFLPVSEGTGRSVGEIVDRYQGSHRAAKRHGSGSYREPLVERSASSASTCEKAT